MPKHDDGAEPERGALLETGAHKSGAYAFALTRGRDGHGRKPP